MGCDRLLRTINLHPHLKLTASNIGYVSKLASARDHETADMAGLLS